MVKSKVGKILCNSPFLSIRSSNSRNKFLKRNQVLMMRTCSRLTTKRQATQLNRRKKKTHSTRLPKHRKWTIISRPMRMSSRYWTLAVATPFCPRRCMTSTSTHRSLMWTYQLSASTWWQSATRSCVQHSAVSIQENSTYLFRACNGL